MKRQVFIAFAVLAFMGQAITASAQGQKASPKMTATGKAGGANVTITYSSPSVKGRTIWGGLVPYDKVWRSGANEATIIETDKEIKLAGKVLPAGKYSFYTIPNEKEWQVIINSQTGQWGIQRSGETTRDPAKDVLVVAVKAKHIDAMQENLLYSISDKSIALRWENLEVAIPVN